MEKLFVLRHILAVVVFVSSTAFAIDFEQAAANDPYFEPITETQAPVAIENTAQTISQQNEKLVAAPIVLKATQDGEEAVAGAVVVEPTPQPENALEILRNELQTLQGLEHEKNQKDGWFKSTNKRFTPEYMTFFLAMGLVTYNSMWIKSHGDPLAMERHILSLKDPIAYLSFYSFMVANGFYIDFKTKTMDPITKSQMMRRLSYQGMAVGSLASSIVSDLGQSGKMCIDYWILGHNDENSVAACNQAWKYWTVRNKFQQYFPQVIAMWASQAATEIIDSKVRKSFTKLTMKESAKKLFSKKVLVNTAKKIVGVDTVLTFAGGTWSIKAIRWVGKLTQFSMFVAVDHAMSPYTYRPLNNLLRPLIFDFDALAINNFISVADKINWEDSRIAEASKDVCTARNPNCLDKKIIEEIESFGTQMQQWREHLNSDAEMDISGWMELTKKLLNQVTYSYKFYKSFVGTMFETLNIGSRIKSGELEDSAADNISLFPFRRLPLYGVSVGPYKTTGGNLEDLYLIATSEMERKQKEHIAEVTKEAEKAVSSLEGASLKKFKSILTKLKSDNVDQIGNGLIDINQILQVNSLKDPTNEAAIYSENFKTIIKEMRKAIGNPMPVVYPFAGFSQAFAANTTMTAFAPDADFSLWSLRSKYMFNKEADLMTYKIFCGKEQGYLEKLTLDDVNLISPQFSPPRLLKNSTQLEDFCSEWRKTRELKVFTENLYGQKIGSQSMYDFFLANFNYSITGDYKNKENSKNFEKWWLENGRQSMDAEFKKYDQQFKKLTEITTQNIFTSKNISSRFKDDLKKLNTSNGEKSSFFSKAFNYFTAVKNAVTNKENFNEMIDHLNQSKYLKSNIKENLQFETNFYLQIIARALDKAAVKPLSDKYSFLEKISKEAANEKFTPVTGANNPVELQKVMDLFNSYYSFILQDKVNFDQYIAHSKKIDTAINDILVLAGLKISSKSNPDLMKKAEASEAELGTLDFSMDAEDAAAVNATPSATGTETSAVTYKDIAVQPNLRQKAITSSVQGLRAVESEIRRFIRMKVALAQGLELDTKEFMEDWNNTNSSQNKMSAPAKANPFGRSGG